MNRPHDWMFALWRWILPLGWCGALAACDRPPAPTSAPATGQSASRPATTQPAGADLLKQWMDAPQKTLALRKDDARRNNPKAFHVVVVFSDFASPECREFARYWDREVEPFIYDKVNYVFRSYPMNASCNPLLQQSQYDQSCLLASMAEAARIQGGNDAFWRMHDELFNNQARPESERVGPEELARRCKLDPQRFLQDIHRPGVRDRIIQDISLAQQVDVQRVPTVYLDGREVTPWNNRLLWQTYFKYDVGTIPVQLQSDGGEKENAKK